MTFEDALNQLLQRFDDAYAELRKVHRDPSFLNNEHPLYKDAATSFVETTNDIFQLKEVWYKADKART